MTEVTQEIIEGEEIVEEEVMEVREEEVMQDRAINKVSHEYGGEHANKDCECTPNKEDDKGRTGFVLSELNSRSLDKLCIAEGLVLVYMLTQL